MQGRTNDDVTLTSPSWSRGGDRGPVITMTHFHCPPMPPWTDTHTDHWPVHTPHSSPTRMGVTIVNPNTRPHTCTPLPRYPHHGQGGSTVTFSVVASHRVVECGLKSVGCHRENSGGRRKVRCRERIHTSMLSAHTQRTARALGLGLAVFAVPSRYLQP